MSDTEKRLGDLIDDYCPRCRLLLNHAVASLIGVEVAKVICQTCYTEHAYRRGEGGKRPSNSRTTLFEQVLARANPSPPAQTAEEKAGKKKATPARYISRHKTRPPRDSH